MVRRDGKGEDKIDWNEDKELKKKMGMWKRLGGRRRGRKCGGFRKG